MIELEFRVRWYQREFHEALVNRTHDRLMAIWHRRAGKDEILLSAIAELSEREVGTYWHCFPEYKQARKAIWNGINPHTGQRRIFDHFPEPTIKRMQDDDMFIELHGGSTFQLLGSDRYDATVGSGPRGIGYSEWALANPSAWAYHAPMLRENKGWAAFITTPRGDNHAKTMFDVAEKSDRWFAQLLSIEDTKALGEDELKEALLEYQALYGIDMGRALYEQEYLCSFTAAIVGAYWGAEMRLAERDGRIKDVPIDERYPVHCVMDLGKAANNPVWLFQVITGQLRVVGFYEPRSEDLDDWCADLKAMGWSGNTYVPHDIMVTEWGSGKTRFDLLLDKKMRPRRIARVSLADGLQAGRMAINAAVFDAEKCEQGLNGLRNYRREWDDERKTFRELPYKDWAEHIGSAWRYLGLAWKEVKPPVEKKQAAKQLEYTVQPDGTVQGNMSVKEAVDRMVKRRRMMDD